MKLNRILVPGILVTTVLLSAPSLSNAEIILAPPPNWQPAPVNNSTVKIWFQNSTNSIFGISTGANSEPNFTLPLAFVAPILAQIIADTGALESTDQLSFGKSNYGYRYFLNLSSLPMEQINATSLMLRDFGISHYVNDDSPLRAMIILTQKHDDLYAILFLSPRQNFDIVLNQIKPTIDSIQLTDFTAAN